MLTLMLLRHAKSSLATAGQADLDRPLNDRGKRAASAVGRYMAANGLAPQLVLCSPARRTRETWDIAAAELPATPRILVADEIYDSADGKALMDCLPHKAGTAQSVLLVGHNPSIGELAQNSQRNGQRQTSRKAGKEIPHGRLCRFHH